MTRKLRWGILSTGSIAGTLARALAKSETSELVAVASRSAEPAARFAAEHGVARAHASYEQLLADAEVEVVYIATPHPSHAQWAIAAAQAKKHILCEKPLAMNEREVRSILQAAQTNDVFLMEAFMYRCHPQTQELVSLIRRGVLGQVKAIQASFGFNGAFPASGRLLNRELGGGGILDVGCYPVSMARLVAGAATGQPFTDPLEVHALGHLGPSTHVDEYSVAICKFPGEILATLATSVQLQQDNVVRVFGTEARAFLRHPWLPAPEGGLSEIVIERPNHDPETLSVSADYSPYVYEVEAVAAQLAQREAREMTPADSLGNAQTLDRWRRAIGLRYEADSG